MPRSDQTQQLDPARARLLQLVEDGGHNLTSLSRAIGRNPGYLRDYVRKQSPAKLDEDERARLAVLLACDPAELRLQTTAPTARPVQAPIPGGQLRILGRMDAGGAALLIDPEGVVGQTPRPPFLLGASEGYAVYVFDDTMSPAFEPGHLVYVDPSRPVRDGDDVIVRLSENRAVLRRLVRRGGRGVVTQQWNPAKREEFSASQISSLHLIVGTTRVRG